MCTAARVQEKLGGLVQIAASLNAATLTTRLVARPWPPRTSNTFGWWPTAGGEDVWESTVHLRADLTTRYHPDDSAGSVWIAHKYTLLDVCKASCTMDLWLGCFSISTRSQLVLTRRKYYIINGFLAKNEGAQMKHCCICEACKDACCGKTSRHLRWQEQKPPDVLPSQWISYTSHEKP